LFGHVSDGQPPIRFQLTTGRKPGSRTGDCAKARGTGTQNRPEKKRIDEPSAKSKNHLQVSLFQNVIVKGGNSVCENYVKEQRQSFIDWRP
jgi:hypothetical protein